MRIVVMHGVAGHKKW